VRATRERKRVKEREGTPRGVHTREDVQLGIRPVLVVYQHGAVPAGVVRSRIEDAAVLVGAARLTELTGDARADVDGDGLLRAVAVSLGLSARRAASNPHDFGPRSAQRFSRQRSFALSIRAVASTSSQC